MVSKKNEAEVKRDILVLIRKAGVKTGSDKLERLFDALIAVVVLFRHIYVL